LKTLIIDQMQKGGAFNYIHTIFHGDGDEKTPPESKDLRKLAKDFLDKAGLKEDCATFRDGGANAGQDLNMEVEESDLESDGSRDDEEEPEGDLSEEEEEEEEYFDEDEEL